MNVHSLGGSEIVLLLIKRPDETSVQISGLPQGEGQGASPAQKERMRGRQPAQEWALSKFHSNFALH